MIILFLPDAFLSPSDTSAPITIISVRALCWFLLVLFAVRSRLTLRRREWQILPLVGSALMGLVIYLSSTSAPSVVIYVILIAAVSIGAPMTQLWVNLLQICRSNLEAFLSLLLGYILLLFGFNLLREYPDTMTLVAPLLSLTILVGYQLYERLLPESFPKENGNVYIILQNIFLGMGTGIIAGIHSSYILADTVSETMTSTMFVLAGTSMMFFAVYNSLTYKVNPLVTGGVTLGFWNLSSLLSYVFKVGSFWSIILAVMCVLVAFVLPYLSKQLGPRTGSADVFAATHRDEDSHNLMECKLERFSSTYSLTAREAEIVRLIVSGLKFSEISTSLSLADGTIKSHASHIYEKLGISSREQLLELFEELE